MSYLPQRRRGQGIRALDYNQIRNTHNRFETMQGRGNVRVLQSPAGTVITDLSDVLPALRDQGAVVQVVNRDTDTLDAFSPVGLDGHLGESVIDLHSERILKGKRPRGKHAGASGIMLDQTPPHMVGQALIAGTAVTRLVRWFPCPFSRAEIYFDPGYQAFNPAQPDYDPEGNRNRAYLMPNPCGSFEIIYAEDAPPEHPAFAIVRFADTPIQSYVAMNVSGATIPHGGPCIIVSGSALSSPTPGELLVSPPDEDDDENLFFSIGGPIPPAGEGRVVMCNDAVMAQVNQAVNENDEVGSKNGSSTLVKDQTGYIVVFQLGSNSNGEGFALIRKKGGGGDSVWLKHDT